MLSLTKTLQQRSSGISLGEMLISMALIGVISAAAIAVILPSIHSEKSQPKTAYSELDQIGKLFDYYLSSKGLIPKEVTPSQIAGSSIAYKSAATIAAAQMPSSCSTVAPATKYVLPDKATKLYISNQWTDPNATYDQDNTVLCLQKGDKVWQKAVLRGNGQQITLGNSPASESTLQSAASSSSVSQSTVSQKTTKNLSVKVSIMPPPPPPPPPNILVLTLNYEAAPANAIVSIYIDGIYYGQVAVGGYAPYQTSFLLPLGAHSVSIQGNSVIAHSAMVGVKGTVNYGAMLYVRNTVHFAGAHRDIGNAKTKARWRGQLNSWASVVGGAYQYVSSYGIMGDWYAFGNAAIDDGQTGARYQNQAAILNRLQHFYSASGGHYYIDTWTGEVYRVGVVWSTPIKVALSAVDAFVNSDDKFKFDIGGFADDVTPVITTPGGLNAKEAWLVFDRDSNGTWQNNTLDNDDLFGDHMGRVKHGYIDLANTFEHALSKDEEGHRYIALSKPEFFDGLWKRITAILGWSKPDPSVSLMLLTYDRKIIPAYKVLKRIYVESNAVEEYDTAKNNAIFQRAKVQYLNGEFAQSADQYFKMDTPAQQKVDEAETEAVLKEYYARTGNKIVPHHQR